MADLDEAKRVWAEYRKENSQAIRDKDKRWRITNREKDRERKRDHNRKRPWEQKAAERCNKRAREKDLPRGMKSYDLYDSNGKLPEFCPIFPNIRLDYNAGPDIRCWASVDKIVPKLGYVSGNVWVISMAANTWKSNGSNPSELKRITALMSPKPKKIFLDSQQQFLF